MLTLWPYIATLFALVVTIIGVVLANRPWISTSAAARIRAGIELAREPVLPLPGDRRSDDWLTMLACGRTIGSGSRRFSEIERQDPPRTTVHLPLKTGEKKDPEDRENA